MASAGVDVSKDLAILGLVGSNYILFAASLFTGAVLYGIYMVLFFAVMSILCRREGIMSARMALLAAVVVLFILSSVYITTNFSYFIIGLRSLIVENAGTVPLKVKNAAYVSKFHVLGGVGTVTFPVQCVIGDAIVIWRAWALSGGNKKIMFIPVMLLIGLTVSCFSYVGCAVEQNIAPVLTKSCLKRNEATFIFSMVTNVAGTAVIGYQTWAYRQAVKKYLQHCRHQVRAEKILIMLLESGVIYSTLLIMQLAVFVSPAKVDSVVDQAFRQVFSATAAQLVGIYPTLMIVLVFLRRSLWDSTGRTTICDNSGDVERTGRSRESNSSHSVHEHDLMRSKPEPGSLEMVFYQQKTVDDSESSRSPTSPS